MRLLSDIKLTLSAVLSVVLSVICPVSLADAFKCIASSGKITYQEKPCQTDQKQQHIPIQPSDPDEIKAAEAKLKAWKMKQDQQDAEKKAAEKQRREERERNEAVEALKKSAEAQRLQAQAELRQAEALENRNLAPAYPAYYLPYPSRPPQHQGRYRSLSTPPGRVTPNPTINRARENQRR